MFRLAYAMWGAWNNHCCHAEIFQERWYVDNFVVFIIGNCLRYDGHILHVYASVASLKKCLGSYLEKTCFMRPFPHFIQSSGPLTTYGDIFGCHNLEVLLTCSGWRPDLLLHILQYTGQPHSKELSSQNASSAHVEKPGFRWWNQEMGKVNFPVAISVVVQYLNSNFISVNYHIFWYGERYFSRKKHILIQVSISALKKIPLATAC